MLRWFSNYRQSLRDKDRAEHVERLNNHMLYGYRYAAGCLLRLGDDALSELSDLSDCEKAKGETGRAFSAGIEAAIYDYGKRF